MNAGTQTQTHTHFFFSLALTLFVEISDEDYAHMHRCEHRCLHVFKIEPLRTIFFYSLFKTMRSLIFGFGFFFKILFI